MPGPLAPIIINAVVGVLVSQAVNKALGDKPASLTIDSSGLDVFLQALSKDFSHQVEEIIRTNTLKSNLQDIKRTLLETTDAFKDFINKPEQEGYYEQAEALARRMYSQIKVLFDEVAPIEICPYGSDTEINIKTIFLNLTRGAFALEMMILGYFDSQDAPSKKIKERNEEYTHMLITMDNELLINAARADAVIKRDDQNHHKNICRASIEQEKLQALLNLFTKQLHLGNTNCELVGNDKLEESASDMKKEVSVAVQGMFKHSSPPSAGDGPLTTNSDGCRIQ